MNFEAEKMCSYKRLGILCELLTGTLPNRHF